MVDKALNLLNLLFVKLNLLFEKATNFCFQNERWAKLSFCGLLCLIGIVMFVLNSLTTMIVDDYGYSFSWFNGARITNLKDALLSQYKHYLVWGGRYVPNSLLQFSLIYDKSVFNIVNTVAYLMLLLVVYYHIVGDFKRPRASVILLVNAAMVFFLQAFGQIFLWWTGAVVYLWSALLVFAYLLPFRKQFEQQKPIIENKLTAIIFGAAGILAAWTNENIAPTMVMMIIIYMITYRRKSGKTPFWCYCALCGCIIGTLLLLLAPGNFKRSEVELARVGVGNFNFLTAILANTIKATKQLINGEYLLIPLTSLIALYYKANDEADRTLPNIYLTGMFLSLYATILTPLFIPNRAKLGILLFCLIAAGNLYRQFDLKKLEDTSKKIFALMMLGIFMLMVTDYRVAYKDIKTYKVKDTAKIEYALTQKRNGTLDIILPHNYPMTRFAAPYGLSDINKDPKDM